MNSIACMRFHPYRGNRGLLLCAPMKPASHESFIDSPGAHTDDYYECRDSRQHVGLAPDLIGVTEARTSPVEPITVAGAMILGRPLECANSRPS